LTDFQWAKKNKAERKLYRLRSGRLFFNEPLWIQGAAGSVTEKAQGAGDRGMRFQMPNRFATIK
jgi:hypothetical protein